MISVVSGKAMIMPRIPSNEPQIESDSRMMAELRPMTFPMIFGVRMVSCMACTMANTASAPSNTIQKLCPVSAALTTASMIVGTKPTSCR